MLYVLRDGGQEHGLSAKLHRYVAPKCTDWILGCNSPILFLPPVIQKWTKNLGID